MNNKEELLNKLKQLEEDFNNQVSDIKEQIKQCDNNKVWKPEYKENYYTFDVYGEGEAIKYTNVNSNLDNDIIKFGSYFKTKEEAERASFELKLHNNLKRFALENNECDIDWDNEEQYKHYVCYDNNNSEIGISYAWQSREFNQVYFTSEEIVIKCIETFKDDLIRYFTTNK